MNATSRVTRWLRSRRLAVALIAFVAVYGFIGTLVPRGAPESAAVVAWAARHPIAEAFASPMGLHHAYASPVFLAVILLLAAATIACSVERTDRALGVYRRLGAAVRGDGPNPGRAAGRVEIPADVQAEDALSRIGTALGRAGFKTAYGDSAVIGVSGRYGLLGSPVFHWALVALMFLGAAGQATKAEGFMGLPIDVRVADVKANYLQITQGPLFGNRFTGLELEASDLQRHYRARGMDMGPAPVITAYRAGLPVASGRVYPNSPLRTGSLMVHLAEFGPAVALSLESSAGAEVARQVFLLDRTAETSIGTVAQPFRLVTQAGLPVDGQVQVVVRKAPPSGSSVATATRVVLSVPAVAGGAMVLGVGDSVDLPGGQRLRVADVRDWVRVSVSNDWSVPWLYAALLVALVGVTIALLVPTRYASVEVVEADGARSIEVRAWHSRRDAAFGERMTRIVREAAGLEDSE